MCVGPESALVEAGLKVVGELTGDGRVVVSGAELESTGYDHFA